MTKSAPWTLLGYGAALITSGVSDVPPAGLVLVGTMFLGISLAVLVARKVTW